MKEITSFINENLLSTIKDKIHFTLKKLFGSDGIKMWTDNEKFLLKYVKEPNVVSHINKYFDINDQLETGYELAEYGGLSWLYGIYTMTEGWEIEEYVNSDATKNWKQSEVDDDFYWFLPALKAWDIDFKDIDEKACIESCKDFYKESRFKQSSPTYKIGSLRI